MKSILSQTPRVITAIALASIGLVGLQASQLRWTLDAEPLPQSSSTASGAVAYDLHLLNLTVTDGDSLVSNVTVTAGRFTGETDDKGLAQLKIAGGPTVPITLTDAAGVTISGHITLPETHAEGLDALIVVDPATGTFDSVTAGEQGVERADLAAARASLDASWLARGFKDDVPVIDAFLAPEADAEAGTGGFAGTDARTAARRIASDSLRARGPVALRPVLNLHAVSLAGLPSQGALSLADPTTEFEKAGYELMHQAGLVDGSAIDPRAALIFEEILDAATLDVDSALAVGAELLRQGVTLEPTLADAIQTDLANLGLDAASSPDEHLTPFSSSSQSGLGMAGGTSGAPDLPVRAPTPKVIDPFESDNTPATCGSIPTNGSPQDRGIDPAGDLDYVCFNLNCGDRVVIETGPIVAGGTGDTHLDFYDPSGQLIASDDDGAATSLWSLIDTVADVTGTHVLKVRGFSTSTVVANYRLTVLSTAGTCDPTLDNFEPNNTSATCASKTPDASYTSHWLRPLGDEDWFCFNVATCGSSVTLDINEPGDPDILTRMQLFSPSGAELLNTTATTPQTVTVTATGTFRVRVTGGSTPGTVPTHDNSADQNTGQYDLSIAIGAPGAACDSFESDSDQTSCNSLPLTGTTISGHSISPTGDEDWYCFDLNCNDTINVIVTPTPPGGASSLRARVELWGPTSTAAILGVSATTNGQTVTLNRAANHAGHWYVRVLRASTAAGAAQTGTYNISATSTAASSTLCDSYEADSSADQCNPPIDFMGGRESKALFPLRDEDWICLGNMACGDTLTIETFATPPANQSVDTYIELYKLPDTTNRVAFDDESGDLSFSRLVFPVNSPSQAGTYVAKIRGFSTTAALSSGPYDVAVTLVNGDCPEPDAFEPDSTTAQCTALNTTGTPVSGHNIFPATDSDFYCVTFACGQNLDVTVTPTGGSLRPIVALLDSAGAVIQTITSPSNGTPVTLVTTDNEAGPHFVRVTSSTSTTGNYNITSTTSMGTCLNDAFEPDDTQATCRAIGLPRTESRAINPATDSDYYCFVLDCGDGVNVTVTPTNGTLRAIIRLKSPSGTTLTTVTATAAGAPVTLNDAVSAPGFYSIEVDSSTSTRGLYDITLSRFTAFNCIDAYEPDNTRDACSPIATDGTLQNHTLLLHPDEDWVCFDVTECGSRVSVGTQPANPSYDDADTTVELYGPDGLLVGSATTGGSASHARLTMIVNEPGTYAARIIPSSSVTTSTSGGQYDLSVTVTDVKKPLTVPPVGQTLLPAGTQLDAQALTQGSGYSMSTGTNPLIDISATGTPLNADGLSAHTVTPGFVFPYYGSSYAQITVQDNGLLSFSDPTWIAGIGNECIPNATTPNDYVAVFWEDLQQGVGVAEVYVQTIGAPGSQVFITQWDKNPIPGGTLVTIEALLYEATGEIEFRYGVMTGPAANGNSATVGIENPDGSDGLQYSCNTALTFSGTSILFSPNNGLVDYPTSPACDLPYEVVTDSAPLIDISGTGTLVSPFTPNGTLTAPDDGHAVRSMPIVFPYFGNFETSVNIHTNGFLTFGPVPTGSTDTNQCPIPNTAVQNGVIAPFWDDLNVTGTSGVYTQYVDPGPGSGDAFYIVQWNAVPFFSATGANTFQVILFEDGVIEYRYGAMTASTRGSGNSATIGIENRTGTVAVMHDCNQVNAVQPGLRITFIPTVPPPRFTWLDPVSGDVLGTGPTYVHPIEAACEVLLRVEVKDPIACCVLTEEQLVTVPDRAAPVITVQPQLGIDGCIMLWPPQHGYKDFSIADTGIEAFDACGNGVSVRFSGASSSSQPEDSPESGDGSSVDDIVISPDGQMVSVRVERLGGCDLDRVYSFFLEVSDSVGNSTVTEAFTACVYHDQGGVPPFPYESAEPGSDSDDTRLGVEGTYGTDCGPGCSRSCDPTQQP